MCLCMLFVIYCAMLYGLGVVDCQCSVCVYVVLSVYVCFGKGLWCGVVCVFRIVV